MKDGAMHLQVLPLRLTCVTQVTGHRVCSTICTCPYCPVLVLQAVLVVTMAVRCALARFKTSQKYQTATHQMRFPGSECTNTRFRLLGQLTRLPDT